MFAIIEQFAKTSSKSMAWEASFAVEALKVRLSKTAMQATRTQFHHVDMEWHHRHQIGKACAQKKGASLFDQGVDGVTDIRMVGPIMHAFSSFFLCGDSCYSEAYLRWN